MELFVYLVLIVEHFKYITMGFGNLYVMMDGTQKRVLLLVGSWVSLIMSPIIIVVTLTMGFGLMMWFVLEMKKR